MRIKKVELNNFKRFTHLIVEDIPESVKLVVLVGPNGSGKTSFMESINHYNKCYGYADIGNPSYLLKRTDEEKQLTDWHVLSTKQLVNVDFHDVTFLNQVGNGDVKGHFYFRSAYRNEPDFRIQTMQRQSIPTDFIRLENLIQNDKTVSSNYQRLVSNTIAGVYNSKNSTRTVESLRDELTGKIRDAVERVFEDLKFASIGNPFENGSFYFDKGITKEFSYCNLSAGEKAAFDLILDMVVQSQYYQDAIYCIDEPEMHMHTRLQGKVLRELYSLVPDKSQLWISTHSIGMLHEAEEIEREQPGTVAFIDFGGRDFDSDQVIRPSKIGRTALEKFYELAFGDFSKLILPKTIVFCEGDYKGNNRKDFDKRIYTTIFGDTHPDSLFISGGSCNDIEKIETTHGAILTALLEHTNIIKIVDRDDRSEQEIKELESKQIKVLKKRNIESYFLDDSLIKKLCDAQGKPEKYDSCILEKEKAIKESVDRGNCGDDYKSARCDIYNSIKKILELTQCGNNADSFIRDTLAPLLTPDMEIYKQLEDEIFGS